MVLTNELRSVQYFNRSPRAFAVATRVFLRTEAARLRRRKILTNGASLIGQMLKVLIDLSDGEPPMWTDAAMDDLIVEDGRVVGARVTRDGTSLNVEARKGVLLAAGGFGHNAEMRRQYSGDQPNEAKWSIANPGDTGEVLQTAMRLGAKTDLLDEAWWLPSVFVADAAPRPRRSARPAAARGHLRRRRPASGSATSRTPTSRSARRCTPTRPCRAGMIFDEGYVRPVRPATRIRCRSGGCRKR